jgi:hypothetical protein
VKQRRRARAVIVCAAASATLALACPKEESIGNSSGNPSSSNQASSSTGVIGPACGDLGDSLMPPSCGDCAVDQCCEQLQACDDSPACLERFACRWVCSDDVCRQSCATSYPDGAAEADALETCLSGCGTACPAPSTICDSTLSTGVADCDACLGTSCCNEVKTCLADAVCNDCLVAGNGANCDQNLLYQGVTGCFPACSTACPE